MPATRILPAALLSKYNTTSSEAHTGRKTFGEEAFKEVTLRVESDLPVKGYLVILHAPAG